MGEMYHEGEYDIAGFAVGAVERKRTILMVQMLKKDKQLLV